MANGKRTPLKLSGLVTASDNLAVAPGEAVVLSGGTGEYTQEIYSALISLLFNYNR